MRLFAPAMWSLAACAAIASLVAHNISLANGDYRSAVRAGLILAAASLLLAMLAAWRSRGHIVLRVLLLLPFIAVLIFAVLDASRRFGSPLGVFR